MNDTQARLVARTQGSSKIEYLYGNLSEPFQLTAVKEAGVLTYHHYDPSGRLMAFDRGGVRYFVQTDQVGTPRVVTDAAGNVVKQIRTSAFGEALSDSAPAFKMYVGYAGGISDSSTGLIRFGFRDYEPLSGRWTARDPILFQGGQGNLYVYVGNSPVMYRDSNGLWTVTLSGKVTGASPLGGGQGIVGAYIGTDNCGQLEVGLFGSIGNAIGYNVGAGIEAGGSTGNVEDLSGPSKSMDFGVGAFGPRSQGSISTDFNNFSGSFGYGVGTGLGSVSGSVGVGGRLPIWKGRNQK